MGGYGALSRARSDSLTRLPHDSACDTAAHFDDDGNLIAIECTSCRTLTILTGAPDPYEI